MSGPRVLTDPDLAQWHEVARLAVEQGDDEALNIARRHIRAWVTERSTQTADQNITDTLDSERPNPVATVAGRALSGLTGLGDEARGALRAVGEAQRSGPGGRRRGNVRAAYDQGTQEYRDAFNKLGTNQTAATIGDVTGIVGQAALFGRARLPGGAMLGADIAQGGQLAGRAGRAVGQAAKLGAVQGGYRGLTGEGDLGQRGTDAARLALEYSLMAAGGTAVGQAGERFLRGRRAAQITRGAEADRQPLLTRNAELRNQELTARAENEQLRSAALRERAARPKPGTPEWRAAKLAEMTTPRPGASGEVNFRDPNNIIVDQGALRAGEFPATAPAARVVDPAERIPGFVRRQTDGARAIEESLPTPPPSGNPAVQPKPTRQVDPTEPTRPAAPGRVYKPRGATKARLAATQSDIARRSLASAPTERMTASVRALFANLPAAEREEAMRAFLGVNAPGRVHPGWVPILNDLRSLP